MKTTAVIDGLFSGIWRPGGGKGGISRQLLDHLCAIYPQGRVGSQGHGFRSSLPFDDPITKEILRALDKEGLRPWQGRARKEDSEFTLDLKRIYSEADFRAAEHLEIVPKTGSKGQYRTDDPLPQQGLIAMEGPAKDAISFHFTMTWYIIRDYAKRVLEAAGLRGLKFLPTVKRYESLDYGLDHEEDTWWELRSEVTLPPLAPSVTLVHSDHTPFTGDFGKGCWRREGFYVHPELHYRRSDLVRIEPFDLALTSEGFSGLPNEFDRPLVASQRFYQICKEHNIETGWVPVRIVND